MAESDRPDDRRLSRRRLLGGGAAALGLGAVSVASIAGYDAVRPAPGPTFGTRTEPFFGTHQAGVTTAPQSHSAFVGLDLRPEADRSRIVGILKAWTDDIARLTRGEPSLADTEPELTGAPSRLTVTVGFGSGLLTAAGVADRTPAGFAPLPQFAVDRLRPEFSGGDLLLQVCADDAITVAHTVRALMRGVRSSIAVRWHQRGFRASVGTHPDGATMRNLMGQVDGTSNPGDDEFDDVVWHDGSDQAWMSGGTSLVLRRIRMELDTWDELDRTGRELAAGRRLDTGAPLTGRVESDLPDFDATDRYGIPVIPRSAHIARAHHSVTGARILRRGYNFDDPPAPGSLSDSGLLFAAYQRDIATQFVPIQRSLDEFDDLNRWTTPVGSATFLIPPGVQPGGWLGETLLG